MRILVVWCPDWPVVAALAERRPEDGRPAGAARSRPVAVLTRSSVVACNQAARVEGVRRGMRRRDAQARCPDLVLLPDNPDRDARAFEPVLAAVEAMRPGVASLRPGLLAIRAPGRFYGGEEHAAALIAERLVDLGIDDIRVGIADDLFAAEQAARLADVQSWRVVPEAGSGAFLRDLGVEVLGDADLVSLLRRLGIDTLGALAALPARDVLTRFGAYGAKVHRLARGADPVRPDERKPPPDLDVEIAFEPPLASVEAVGFSVRATAERFVARLGELGLVATAVRVEAEGDDADRTVLSSRLWVHSRWFTAVDLVDRVHWQLQAAPDGTRVGAAVALVRFVPETTEPGAVHAEGLWGGGTDERVDRGVARVQAMLGYDAVRLPVRQGGRAPADRQRLVPWGERPTGLRPVEQPWPGSIPPPAPTLVYAEPPAGSVLDDLGRTVSVTERGAVTGPPAHFRVDASTQWQRVLAWAGPWPADERWWTATDSDAADAGTTESRLPVARFQFVGADGQAWLMRCEGEQWWTEASYD